MMIKFLDQELTMLRNIIICKRNLLIDLELKRDQILQNLEKLQDQEHIIQIKKLNMLLIIFLEDLKELHYYQLKNIQVLANMNISLLLIMASKKVDIIII